MIAIGQSWHGAYMAEFALSDQEIQMGATMAIPSKIKYVIIGAGVHGLSASWHLAKELKARGRGSGEDIVILDKTGVGAGASGIACGLIRAFYYQPAMAAIMRGSIDIWHSDPEGFDFTNCGYIALVPEPQNDDVEAIYGHQQAQGFEPTLVQGEQKVFDYMRQLFPDWRARGHTSILHEHESGVAFNKPAMQGIADKAEVEGVRIVSGVKVTGFKRNGSGEVQEVVTDQGNIEVEQVVVGAGPWTGQVWDMLGLPDKIDVKGTDGAVHKDRDMWAYWRLQEGEIRVDPNMYVTADGKVPPVFHFDSMEPLVSLKSGQVITDGLWGIYWKQDKRGVQGGAEPENLGSKAQIDPYGPESPLYTVKEDFEDQWTSGLSHAMARFENCHHDYLQAPSGGVGCFTADNFPIFDYAPGIPNVYILADSNHGFKMISVGQETAKVLMGEKSDILYPFRYSRFAEGDLHPVSKSPYPWG